MYQYYVELRIVNISAAFWSIKKSIATVATTSTSTYRDSLIMIPSETITIPWWIAQFHIFSVKTDLIEHIDFFKALKYTWFFQKMESFATLQWGLKIAHSVLALFQNTHIHGRHTLSLPHFFPQISHLQGSYLLVSFDWHRLLSSDWLR